MDCGDIAVVRALGKETVYSALDDGFLNILTLGYYGNEIAEFRNHERNRIYQEEREKAQNVKKMTLKAVISIK